MKKILSLLAVAALVMVACKPEGGQNNNTSSDSITVAPESYVDVPYEGETFTVTVKASGQFTAAPSAAWITVNETTITIAANDTYEARNGEVVFTCGTATAKVTFAQLAAPKPIEYTPLSSGPANCYIIDEAGNYSFDGTVIGNGDEGNLSSFGIASTKIAPTGVKLVWEEAEGLITNLVLKEGKVCFTVAQKDGNAVIAATDKDDNVLWSWHIWSAEAPNDVKCNDDFTLMDRNLGATLTTGTEANGLYYQWGRKDPFSAIIAFDSGLGEGHYHPVVGGGEDKTNAEIHSMAYAIAHPAEYITDTNDAEQEQNWCEEVNHMHWGIDFEADGELRKFPEHKTIFDPCPAGYCVASASCFWFGWNTEGGASTNAGVITLFGGKITVPAAGFIYIGGYGWYDANGAGWGGLWSCSSSWGTTKHGFRLSSGPGDPNSHNGTAAAHPVRCMKI